MQIHIQRNGQQYGPYTVEELDQLLQSESITGDDLYWHEGQQDWAPLSQFPGFHPAPSSAMPPPPPPTKQAASTSSSPKQKQRRSLKFYVAAGVIVVVLGIANLILKHYLPEEEGSASTPTSSIHSPAEGVDESRGANTGIIEVKFIKTAPTTSKNVAAATGEITNRSSMLIPQLFMTVRALDIQGVVLADHLERVKDLAPGQTAQFTTTFFDVPYERLGKLAATLGHVFIADRDQVNSFQLKVIPFDEAAGNVLSIEAARKAAVGTWTGRKSDLCLRLVFNEDGTYEEYTPLITADGWGEPHRGTWEAFTDKYDNTGKRYYGLRLSDGGHVIVETSTQMRHPNLEAVLTKGDSFPFSK